MRKPTRRLIITNLEAGVDDSRLRKPRINWLMAIVSATNPMIPSMSPMIPVINANLSALDIVKTPSTNETRNKKTLDSAVDCDDLLGHQRPQTTYFSQMRVLRMRSEVPCTQCKASVPHSLSLISLSNLSCSFAMMLAPSSICTQ